MLSANSRSVPARKSLKLGVEMADIFVAGYFGGGEIARAVPVGEGPVPAFFHIAD